MNGWKKIFHMRNDEKMEVTVLISDKIGVKSDREFFAVQWLRLGAFTAMALVQSLVQYLRSHMLQLLSPCSLELMLCNKGSLCIAT